MNADTCYMCEALATTSEHAPPKCIFPESKDVGDGVDYRKELITVPSCDAHNSAKCKDDEYLRAVLLAGYFNNEIGHKHFRTKLLRAITNNPAIYRQLFSTATPVTVDGNETASITIDRKRFDRSLEHCIRALHFHKYGTKVTTDITVHSHLFLEADPAREAEVNARVRAYAASLAQFLRGAPKLGKNPQVFWYQIANAPSLATTAGRLNFYEGFDVFFHYRTDVQHAV